MDDSLDEDYVTRVPEINPVKNTVVLSTSFLLCYTAFQAIQNLQSSLNQSDDLGMASLACVYGMLVVSAILAPMMIHLLGTKLALVLGWAAHCLYTAANFYPTWWSLIPASLVFGFFVGPMWTSQGVYITTMADIYSRAKHVGSHEAMSKLFGIFGLLFQSAQITGSLIASLVLFRDAKDVFPANVTRVCGADDCPGISSRTTDIPHPSQATVNSLMGVYFSCDFLGLLLTMCFLTPIARVSFSDATPRSKVKEWFTSLKDVELVLIIPFFFAKSMIVSILLTSFTKAFVSCTLGIRMVGYVMVCYGGSTAVLSYVFGRVAKFTGRYPLFAASYLLELGAVFFMLLWKPTPDKLYANFIFVLVCAASDGMWLTQSAALVGVLFSHKRDTAFANFSTFGALAFCVTVSYDRFVCLSTKLYISIVLWIIGAVCYITVEIRAKFERPRFTGMGGYEEIN